MVMLTSPILAESTLLFASRFLGRHFCHIDYPYTGGLNHGTIAEPGSVRKYYQRKVRDACSKSVLECTESSRLVRRDEIQTRLVPDVVTSHGQSRRNRTWTAPEETPVLARNKSNLARKFVKAFSRIVCHSRTPASAGEPSQNGRISFSK
jgi:hypothetical protein